jgi:hypothetical protein
MSPDPAYLALALSGEPVRDFMLVQHDAGLLHCPSGGLVCCDPLVFAGSAEPFSLPLPAGAHRVILTIAKTDQDARVAFSRVHLRDTTPVVWDLMTLEGQDQSQLGPQEIFGYGVDTGTGCFADALAIRELDELMSADKDYWQRFDDAMEKAYTPTWSWINWQLPSRLNVVAFSSGYGDGIYASFVGLDADNELACVVTDFQVLPYPGEDDAE